MARRQSSTLEEFFEICCAIFRVLPPWTSIPMSVAVFLIPTAMFASISFPNLLGIPGSPLTPIGMAIGFLGSLACLFAGFKAHERREQQQSFVGAQVDLSWVDRLSWRDFERQVAEVYRQEGYWVEECGGNGPDGGVDLRLTRGGERVLVQCKHWKSWKVGAPVVRELYGVLMAEGANRAVVITSGRISREAVSFAEGKPLELVSGDGLLALLRKFQRNLAASLGQTVPVAKEPTFQTVSTAPACPRCGEGMVLKLARKGASAGREFWSCHRFPACHGSRSA